MADFYQERVPQMYARDTLVHQTILQSWEPHPLLIGADSPARFASPSIEVQNEGPIKHMAIPAGWMKGNESRGGIGQRSLDSFNPPAEPSVKMSLYYRGLPVDADASRAFAEVLNAGGGGVQVLSARQIADLAQALGETTVGDNQYTYAREHNQKVENDPARLAAADARTAPAFHISSAQRQMLNGKNVIVVEGNFVDNNGRKVNDYQGVYIDAGNGKIEEVMFQAERGQSDRPDKYAKYLSTFKKSLQSIEW